MYLNWHRLNEIGFVRLVKIQFLLLVNIYFVFIYIHFGMLLLTIFAGCRFAIKVNLWLLRHIVVELKRFNLKIRLLWYKRVYIKTLLYILANNKYMGNVFLIFLVVNFPINCYFLLRIKNSASPMVKILVSFIFFEQVLVIFGVHWLFASLNSKFNKNIKCYTSKFVPNNCFIRRFSCVNFISNLRISLFIQNYHTKRKFGFTYGKFGLISLMAFTKVR